PSPGRSNGRREQQAVLEEERQATGESLRRFRHRLSKHLIQSKRVDAAIEKMRMRLGVGETNPVYGAQHPPLDPRLTKNFIKERSKVSTVPLKNKKASSFHEFARNTSDAWDIGDDEEEDFSSPSFQTLNSKVALATAAQVLENHSKLRVRPERSQSTTSEVPAGYKVIKSSSDAQLSRNSSDTCLRNPLHKQQSLPLRPIIPLVARISDQNASGAPPMTVREKTRLEKFRQLLSSHNTDLDELRKCSWPGVPREVRPVTWRLLSGYLPANTERRKLTLQRKREEYFGFIEQYYDSRNEEHHQDTYRQIHIDIPRTNPLIPLFQQPLVQEIFERILFIWAIRHPASGYVQGINDLVTPFFVVFLSEYVGKRHEYQVEQAIALSYLWSVCFSQECSQWARLAEKKMILGGFIVHLTPNSALPILFLPTWQDLWTFFTSCFTEEDVENFDVTNLSQDMLRSIEADSFWCMSKLLDGIQDNYTFAQPGIQKKVKALEELVSRIDATTLFNSPCAVGGTGILPHPNRKVHNHFRRYEVEYLQFAFRWMNNLLMRELPLRCTIRLWDTYQSEPEGFSHFHLYVCAAFLIKWRKEILDEEDFQGLDRHFLGHGLLMLLQNLPTIHWGNEEIGLLLAEAYRLKYMFADAPNHYRR
ncbi:hypothetical protein EI555_005015, partial [Monodon monoceros]